MSRNTKVAKRLVALAKSIMAGEDSAPKIPEDLAKQINEARKKLESLKEKLNGYHDPREAYEFLRKECYILTLHDEYYEMDNQYNRCLYDNDKNWYLNFRGKQIKSKDGKDIMTVLLGGDHNFLGYIGDLPSIFRDYGLNPVNEILDQIISYLDFNKHGELTRKRKEDAYNYFVSKVTKCEDKDIGDIRDYWKNSMSDEERWHAYANYIFERHTDLTIFNTDRTSDKYVYAIHDNCHLPVPIGIKKDDGKTKYYKYCEECNDELTVTSSEYDSKAMKDKIKKSALNEVKRKELVNAYYKNFEKIFGKNLKNLDGIK